MVFPIVAFHLRMLFDKYFKLMLLSGFFTFSFQDQLIEKDASLSLQTLTKTKKSYISEP